MFAALIFIESPNKSDSYEGRMEFFTLIWVGAKKGQWHLLLELLSSGTIRHGCISKLEERLQLDYHFSPIAALLLESFTTVFESVRVQRAQIPASFEAGFSSFWLKA